MNEEQRVAEYTRVVGHPPENRPDDPDWNYRGTKEELKELRKRLGLKEETDVIDGQMELI